MIRLLDSVFGRGGECVRGGDDGRLARSRRRSTRLACEGLEGRRLMSSFARSYSGGTGTDMVTYRPSDGEWSILKGGAANFNSSISYQWGAKGDIPIEDSDFFGNGHADLAVFRPSNGTWYIKDPVTGQTGSYQWGAPGDVPLAAGNYFGFGRAALAVWRPSNGTWYFKDAVGGWTLSIQWGTAGDVPVAGANFDGDGRTDLEVFRPSDDTWHILTSATSYSTASALTSHWGNPGDVPILNSDFFGYGRDDVAVFRPSNGTWYAADLRTGTQLTAQWGTAGDVPLGASNFFGDGRADLAVYRPSTGTFFVKDPRDGSTITEQFGARGDVPIANADFDGDGKADLAVFRPSDGTWHVRKSSYSFSSSGEIDRQWGTSGDQPIPGPLGPDPILTGSGAHYSSFQGRPLFAPGGPAAADVVQGQAGDCYFLVELAGLAKSDPNRIRRDIVDMGNGTYAVDLEPAGRDQYVLVDAELPVDSSGNPIDAKLGPNNVLWVALMEKAWTYFRPRLNVVLPNGAGTVAPTSDYGTYAMLDGAGTQTTGGAPGGYQWELFDLMGYGHTNVSNTPGSSTSNLYQQESFLAGIENDLANGHRVLVATGSTLVGTSKLIATHSYSVDHINYSYDQYGFATPVSVVLYNPHGTYDTVSVTDFEQNVLFETKT